MTTKQKYTALELEIQQIYVEQGYALSSGTEDMSSKEGAWD